MSSEIESEDAFDPSPLPTKRRRLNTCEDDAGQRTPSLPSPNARLESAGRTPPKKRSQKPKHLIRVHTATHDNLQDNFCSQPPDANSSPWRIRGARWHKPHLNLALADKSPNVSAANEGDVLSPQLPDLEPGIHTDPESPPHTSYNSSQSVPDLEPSVSPQKPMSPGHGRAMGNPPGNIHALDFDIDKELADLPSDAFASTSSSPQRSQGRGNVIVLSSQPSRSPPKGPNRAAPQKGLQQMTLFGGHAAQEGQAASQSNKKHNWPLKNQDESPTHHKLDEEALKTYVYPTNLGNTRDYQFSIVKRGLYHNLLVALPTGLGKTFIAATIMLNWFRWTKDAQIVFVAPTKPLVSQQVEACFGIAGIPRSQTTMLTGGVSPARRAEEWSEKRVFFMTPQTIINDLKAGICNPKRIVLLVVDEAHRATGSYAYVEVVKFVRRFNQSFRVLALTATPGNSVETVQEVINGLDISRVEIRTEFSIDIRQYVHARKTEQVIFENSEEMELIMDLFSKALRPTLDKLRTFNAFWSADPMQLTAYGLTQARQRWFSSAGRTAEASVKGMLTRIFSVLASLAHSIELLKYHGIGPFYHGMISFQNSIDSTKGNKYEKLIADSEPFRKMMTTLKFWVHNPQFIGHPKLEYLQSVVLKHFSDAAEGRGSANGELTLATRIMIFAHYRDSAEEIVRVLKRNEPMIRPHVFVGQAASKGSEGMDQKKQLEVIQQFKSGKFNTLVATSIGEEGLDIGEIDLIICYDSSASPIRMLQRMGRTGRKRAGNIILLLMKGKEENSFVAAKDNYEKMQQMISDAKRFEFHDDRSRRIIPRHLDPVVDVKEVVIPPENKQSNFLPEPKPRGKASRRPPKKFNMPDGVRTGFVRASKMDDQDLATSDDSDAGNPSRWRSNPTTEERVEPVPPLDEVFLTREQFVQLSKYQDIPSADDDELLISTPSLSAHPSRLSNNAPIASIKHGLVTNSAVQTFKAMRRVDDNRISVLKSHAQRGDSLTISRCSRILSLTSEPMPPVKSVRATSRKRQQTKATQTTKYPQKRAFAHDEDVIEAMSSSPPPTDPRLQLQSQGIDLGSDTSGEDGPEGEPSSQLRDFIVDEDDDIDEEPESPLSTSSETMDHFLEHNTTTSKPFYVSQKSIEGESGDEELPDLQALLQVRHSDSTCNRPGKGGMHNEAHDAKNKRKRRVVEDSSD